MTLEDKLKELIKGVIRHGRNNPPDTDEIVTEKALDYLYNLIADLVNELKKKKDD